MGLLDYTDVISPSFNRLRVNPVSNSAAVKFDKEKPVRDYRPKKNLLTYDLKGNLESREEPGERVDINREESSFESFLKREHIKQIRHSSARQLVEIADRLELIGDLENYFGIKNIAKELIRLK